MTILLLQNGDDTLLQSGDMLLLEEGIAVPPGPFTGQTFLLLNEDGTTSIGFLLGS